MDKIRIPALGELNPKLYTLSDKEVEIIYLHGEKELHRFPAPINQQGKPYQVAWTTDELTSVCPVTGQPDFCKLFVEYVPDKWCVELKSAKFYIVSYRNEGHFYEELINQIYSDIYQTISPRRLFIRGDFNSRGGMPESVSVGDLFDEEEDEDDD